MAAKILEFTKVRTGYRLRVHLDGEKPLTSEWLHEWTFPNLHPEIHTEGPDDAPLTEEKFIANLMEELPRMVEVELHNRGVVAEDFVHKRFAEHEGRSIN